MLLGVLCLAAQSGLAEGGQQGHHRSRRDLRQAAAVKPDTAEELYVQGQAVAPSQAGWEPWPYHSWGPWSVRLPSASPLAFLRSLADARAHSRPGCPFMMFVFSGTCNTPCLEAVPI